MGWLTPLNTGNANGLDQKGIEIFVKALGRELTINDQVTSINRNFETVYNNSIYTSWESILGLLKYITYYKLKIDVVLFTGHAGNGHRAPTRAIVKKLIQKTDKNVIIIDLLALFSSKIANINDKSWVMLSRSETGQKIWSEVIRGEINIEKTGFDIAPLFKVLYTKKLKALINKLQPSVVLSTYPYANAILSKIAKDNPCISFASVVVTDTEMLGFAMSAYKDVSNLHYFVASEESWRNGLKIYPYLKDAQDPIYIGTNPCFFDEEPKGVEVIKDTVLFIPGSAEGLGMGIKALPQLAEFCRRHGKRLICVSGMGHPYKFAKHVHAKYKDIMSLFSYIASEDLKNLITASEVVIAKAGGNMSSELVSINGCKIFFASIKGQETDNADYYAKLGLATNVGNNVNKLFKAILEKPFTPSIYSKGIITKSAVDVIVDTILPYLD